MSFMKLNLVPLFKLVLFPIPSDYKSDQRAANVGKMRHISNRIFCDSEEYISQNDYRNKIFCGDGHREKYQGQFCVRECHAKCHQNSVNRTRCANGRRVVSGVKLRKLIARDCFQYLRIVTSCVQNALDIGTR